MKCKYCKYMHSLSTENGSYYWCDFFDEDDPTEEFVIEDGCNLRPKEAEKLYKLKEQIDNFSYDPSYRKEMREACESYNAYFDELSRRHKKYYGRR